MSFLPLAFTTPAILAALVLLPAIWWLLRLTPPRPAEQEQALEREIAKFAKREEQPARSPWWLTLLRLALAALVIFALAGPVYKPIAETVPGNGPLLLVVENGWASAPQWQAMVDTARRIVGLAESESRPVALLATAEGPRQPLVPTDAATVRQRLDALAPRPFAADHGALVPALAEATSAAQFGGVAWLSDGMGGSDVDAFARSLRRYVKGETLVYADPRADLFGLKPPVGTANALSVPVVRRDAAQVAGGNLRALDLKGRVIGEAPFAFKAGEAATAGEFKLPVELRNEITRVEVAGMETAGSVQLLDERWRRRKIGLLSGASADTAQPLLSPLYYISRAVQPFADVDEPRDANAAVAVPELIEAGVSIIAMADIGTLTPDVEETVAKWVRDGGTLVRFAGPRLAAATDALIPVQLRHGDRVLGGTLTWQTPQPLASFSANSPFAGMTVPGDVQVTRQVLAEPDGTLSERTWAALADGTPLVTAVPSGKGWLVLFHVTADTSWSNLPLSGTFVDMLRRIIAFSTAVKGGGGEGGANAQTIAPYRLLDGHGRFTTPGAEAEPIPAGAADVRIDASHPPGLYGTDAGFRSLNLLGEDASLPPFNPATLASASVRNYPTASPTEIGPWLLTIAFGLLILDAISVLWLAGAFSPRLRRAAAAVMFLAVLAGGTDHRDPAFADDASDKFALEAVKSTRLAYVLTGNPTIDATSKAGLHGLSEVLAQRTALEPGDPIGVDPSKDELAFFPLIYWPVDASVPMPTAATMSRIDAYMRQGGSVLFDTRDQLERSTNAGTLTGTPAVERLREMLSSLDVPPLEPVPADHVLTKAFYLLNDFPGRYSGGPLWVETTQNAERSDRPAQAGDGVSTILITENDFASAWATDANGSFLFPTVPTDPLQREMAYRTGINIVMYTLTGNYKADQVHVPALLERLGQ
jgi:hypothetical protein